MKNKLPKYNLGRTIRRSMSSNTPEEMSDHVKTFSRGMYNQMRMGDLPKFQDAGRVGIGDAPVDNRNVIHYDPRIGYSGKVGTNDLLVNQIIVPTPNGDKVFSGANAQKEADAFVKEMKKKHTSHIVHKWKPSYKYDSPDTFTWQDIMNWKKSGAENNDQAASFYRASQYRPFAEQAGLRYGIDPDILISLIAHESWGLNSVTSPTGAGGIAQFLGSTARGEGLTVNDTQDDRRNPEIMVDAAAKYLRGQYDAMKRTFPKWDDDKLLRAALKGYNWGGGAYRNYVKHGKEPSDWADRDYDETIIDDHLKVIKAQKGTPDEPYFTPPQIDDFKKDAFNTTIPNQFEESYLPQATVLAPRTLSSEDAEMGYKTKDYPQHKQVEKIQEQMYGKYTPPGQEKPNYYEGPGQGVLTVDAQRELATPSTLQRGGYRMGMDTLDYRNLNKYNTMRNGYNFGGVNRNPYMMQDGGMPPQPGMEQGMPQEQAPQGPPPQEGGQGGISPDEIYQMAMQMSVEEIQQKIQELMQAAQENPEAKAEIDQAIQVLEQAMNDKGAEGGGQEGMPQEQPGMQGAPQGAPQGMAPEEAMAMQQGAPQMRYGGMPKYQGMGNQIIPKVQAPYAGVPGNRGGVSRTITPWKPQPNMLLDSRPDHLRDKLTIPQWNEYSGKMKGAMDRQREWHNANPGYMQQGGTMTWNKNTGFNPMQNGGMRNQYGGPLYNISAKDINKGYGFNAEANRLQMGGLPNPAENKFSMYAMGGRMNRRR